LQLIVPEAFNPPMQLWELKIVPSRAVEALWRAPLFAIHERAAVNRDRGGTIDDLILKVAIPGTLGERPVIDATWLTGNSWEVLFAQAGPPSDIFRPFEEQLGLKLEARTGRWEVIVIDDVRMPTPNCAIRSSASMACAVPALVNTWNTITESCCRVHA
jgi:hypothetical protein